MKHILLLLLRNATKHNSVKFSAARLHVSSDKFWNGLKDLKCNNVKNSCLLVNKRTLRSTKLKKNICNTFFALKRKKSQKSTHLLRCTKCMSHVGYWHITMHFIFFNDPTSIKWFVSWTVGSRLLKPFCGTIIGWLNFRLGVIIGLIHALEKRYLRYNFGSVYLALSFEQFFGSITGSLRLPSSVLYTRLSGFVGHISWGGSFWDVWVAKAYSHNWAEMYVHRAL